MMKLLLWPCALLILLSSCTHLFFRPDRWLYVSPEKLGYSYQNLMFSASDGTRLHAWFFPTAQEKPKGLIVQFHGNAQNISSHHLSVSWLTEFGYDVFTFDYRGYGLSQGEADLDGVYLDSMAALNYSYKLFQKKNYSHYIVFGQSLGGNILLRGLQDFEHKNQLTHLVLDSTFIGYKKIAVNRMQNLWLFYPLSPLGWLLISDKYSPRERMNEIQIPTLVMHGTRDEIIPTSFGEEAYNLINFPLKKMWMIKGEGHIGGVGPRKIERQKEFLQLISELSSPPGS